MYTKRRFSIFILLLCMAFPLQGCGADKTMASQSSNIYDSSSKAASIVSSSLVPSTASKTASANMQLIDADTYSLEIPSSWTKTKASDFFLPQGADVAAGASNASIIVNAVSGTAMSLANYKVTFPAQFEKQIKLKLPDATNFQYSDMKAGGRDVFIASFNLTATAKQTLYYPINSKYVVILTIADNGDGDKIGLKDISKHMLDTLVLK